MWKDFNIEEEALGVLRPVIRYFNATVTDSVLEIRFYWAGKGTARIPFRGHYGSLISAISVDSSMYLLTFYIFGWIYRDCLTSDSYFFPIFFLITYFFLLFFLHLVLSHACT